MPNEPIERLQQDVDTYKHAFETTTADRDRVETELAQARKDLDAYRHAFETTTADRDRIAAELAQTRADLHSMVDVLDAGYFRFDFSRFNRFANEWKELGQRLATDWETLFREGRYIGVIESVLENVPVKMALESSESEYKSLAAYYIASLMTRIPSLGTGQTGLDAAAGYARYFYYSAPPDGADFLPYDLKQASRIGSWQRTRAAARGRPGMLITSMPKSASAFLSYSLSQLLEIPVLRSSIGDGVRSLVVDRWAREIAGGGAVTHEHFSALPQNLDALNRAGITTLWLQVRDPRDCAYSHWKMRENWFSGVKHQTTEAYTDHGYTDEADVYFLMASIRLSRWISDWLEATADGRINFKIEIITYDEVTTNLPQGLKRMLGSAYSEDFDKSVRALVSRFESGESQAMNFRQGKGGEWRKVFSSKLQQDVYDQMHDNTKDCLNLTR